MVNLTEEQRVALQQHPEGVACKDAATERIYFLIDSEMHQRAMQALKQQQDLSAIQRGLRDMEADEGTPVQVARQELSAELDVYLEESTVEVVHFDPSTKQHF